MNNVEDIYTLTPLQEGILFHILYAPGSGAYVVHIRSRVEGDLNVPAFRRAWQKIMSRHAMLRTAFLWEHVEKPLQVVHRQAPIHWEECDWRSLPEQEQDLRLKDYLQAEHRTGFDPSTAPLFRLALFRVRDDCYEFVWNYSHLLLDGWSVHLIFDEVFAYYRAYSRNRDLRIPLQRPFRDYIAWLQQQNPAGAESFWRKHLRGFSTPTSVSLGSYHDPVEERKDHQYLELSVKLSNEDTSLLGTIARRHRLTLNTFVQAAWGWLLGYYNRTDDVLFGATVAGRPVRLRGSDFITGMLVNTLPMRIRISPDERLLDWLNKVQTAQGEIQEYDYTPLLEVKAFSELDTASSLFESMVIFENHPAGDGFQLGDKMRFVSGHVFQSTGYPLTLMSEPGERLWLRLMYDANRYQPPAIQKTLDHLSTLLASMARNPEQRVGELSALTRRERQQLLLEWNTTDTNQGRDSLFLDMFHAQVQRNPDSIAVQFGDRFLTYGQLNRRANQLGHFLAKCGVQPEVKVAICMDRSLEMVVGLLGVLKAGGAYIPLDPHYPPERLAYVLEDSGAALLLSERDLLGRLSFGNIQTILLDGEWTKIALESCDDPSIEVLPDSLACVIYTSGSTGRPKGVQIPHSALANFLCSMATKPGMTSEDVLLAVTTLSFDIAGLELYLPLSVGAQIRIVSHADAVDGKQLRKEIDSGVTVMQATPATWLLLLESGWEWSPGLKVLCGGESFPIELAEKLVQRAGSLWNMYGPTETTIWSLLEHIERGTKKVLVGRPIANTKVYVLDKNMEPLPPGIAGELYIGSAGLARGYLNRSDLTAERFVPHPFTLQAGERLYRTGDLARFSEEGKIEILGRVDQQVKIRGFRVELGEIEAALHANERVERAAVTVSEHGGDNKRLVAYIVPRSEIAVDQLRAALQQRLPEYMVPANFVMLQEMPLTANGKINRKALPAPPSDSHVHEELYISPRTDTERSLASIWTDILHVDRVGIQDNFFAMGGHSLLATRAVARIRDTFKMDVPVRAVFEAPTIAKLAGLIDNSRTSRKPSDAPSPESTATDLPAMPSMQRMQRDSVFVAADEE